MVPRTVLEQRFQLLFPGILRYADSERNVIYLLLTPVSYSIPFIVHRRDVPSFNIDVICTDVIYSSIIVLELIFFQNPSLTWRFFLCHLFVFRGNFFPPPIRSFSSCRSIHPFCFPFISSSFFSLASCHGVWAFANVPPSYLLRLALHGKVPYCVHIRVSGLLFVSAKPVSLRDLSL